MYELTAAHKSLPFGTFIMVTNLNNGKTVTVRINDRGPFVKGRILDLSYAAAKVLDMVDSGVAPVRIEILKDKSNKLPVQKFSVQVGSFISEKNAKDLKNILSRSYKDVYIARYNTQNQTYFRVRIKAPNKQSAKKIAEKLTKDGYTVLVLEEQ